VDRAGGRGAAAAVDATVEIKLNDPAPLNSPDRTAMTTTARHGEITVSAWDEQHVSAGHLGS
jgi:hypothetical protein